MSRKLALLAGISVLASCSSGPDGVVSTADTAAPAVTLTPSSASIEGGETVAITASATDTVDGAVTPTLSCSGGTLTGNLLVTGAVTADSTITCTGTATDKAGNRGTATTTITVKATVTSVTSESGSTMVQGQFGVLSVANLTLTENSYAAKLGDRDVKLYRNGAMLGYIVPADMPAGTHRLDFQLGARRYTYQLTITAAATIADQKAFVAGKLNEGIAKLDAVVAESGASLTSGQRAAFDEYRSRLVAGLAQLDTLSAADLNRLAVGLQSNIAATAALTAGGGSSSFASFNPLLQSAAYSEAQCNAALGVFGGYVSGALLGVVLATGAINSDPEPISRLTTTLILAISIPVLLKATGMFSAIDGVMAKCIDDSQFQLSSAQQQSGRVAFVQALDVATTYGFVNKQSKSFTLTETRQLNAGIRARAQALFDKMSFTVSLLPRVTPEITSALGRFFTQKTETVPASQVELASVSDSKILGIKTGSDETITLTFSYVGDPPSENVPFNFTLTKGGTPIPMAGQLVVALPGAEDGAVPLIQGRPITSQLQVRGAESIEIVESPTKGTATISTAGLLTYTPTAQLFGSDRLTYRARNANGVSRTATVLLTINRQFEGTWKINIRSTTATQSPANSCPNENKNVTVFVSKVSDTQYSATYDGTPLNFTMASKDDPAGLRAQVSGTFDDGPGKTTETLTVNIPNSNFLDGGSSWRYVGPGVTCEGGTLVLGNR